MKLARDASNDDELTYVGETFAETINAYTAKNRENARPFCQISAPDYHPLGMTTDLKGTLFVSGTLSNSDDGVATFEPNCGAAGRQYYDANVSIDPVVDGSLLYVTNYYDNGPAGTPVTIEVYKVNGGGTPTRELSYPPITSAIGVAVDSHHNLFWSNTDSAVGQIIEFPDGKAPGKILQATRIGKDSPGGVMVDKSGNLLFIDQTASTIEVYASPYTAPAFLTLPLKGWEVYCAFGRHETRFYCLDYEYGSVDAYTYPVGKYLYSYSNGIDKSDSPVGIAIQRLVSEGNLK
jgi:sugar lactone lactonase YvrE